MSLADEFDGFLVDLDGVVWVGREPVPGSAGALAELLEAGKEIVFVTNNPGRAPEAYARRLGEIGVAVGPERIVTAGMATAALAAERAAGAAAFVAGPETLKEMVAAAGAPLLGPADAAEAAVVVVAGHRGFDYEELLGTKRALDAGAALLATSRDPTLPMPGGAWPGTGAVLAAVETASGRTAEIGGKPERHLFDAALDAIGRPQRVAMVGDRVTSDVVGGHRAGLVAILVLSGAGDRAEAEAAPEPPEHVVEDLAALLR